MRGQRLYIVARLQKYFAVLPMAKSDNKLLMVVIFFRFLSLISLRFSHTIMLVAVSVGK